MPRLSVLNPPAPPVAEFQSFIEESKNLQHCGATQPNIGGFLEFIKGARPFSVYLDKPSPVVDFKKFIRHALRTAIARVKHHLPAIVECATITPNWLFNDDLLDVAGLSFVEDAYTELMAWALHPDTHPPSAARRQQEWLKSLGLEQGICGKDPCVPQTQVITEDGIPDLILHFPKLVIIVEAKTSSNEHLTPSGEMQTISYAQVVRKMFEIDALTVFITPDRRMAANSQAKLSTFTEFAMFLAKTMKAEDLPQDTRAAFAMLITHFISCAKTIKIPVRELRNLINRIEVWRVKPHRYNNKSIFIHLSDLLNAIEVFGLVEINE